FAPHAHHLLVAEETELLAPLEADTREEGGELVVVALAPLLKRMMVTAGALHPHAEEHLARRLCKVLRVTGNAVVVARPVGEGTALRQNQIARELVDRAVLL